MSPTIEIRSDADKTVFQALKSFEGALVQAHLETLTKFASMAIQGAFILNGTVGIAAFATDTMSRVYPVILCSFGAVCALISACFAFFAQRKHFSYERDRHSAEVYNWLSYAIHPEVTDQLFLNAPLPYGSIPPTRNRASSVTLLPYKNPWAVASAVFVVLSIVLFCIGLWITIWIYRIEVNA